MTSRTQYRAQACAERGMTESDRVQLALAYGLGTEDIRVLHGIPEDRSRSLIAIWRERGTLQDILRGQA